VHLPDLLFGVATSDHQAEAFDSERPDFRDEWEKQVGQTPRGRATDFWNRYEEDIKLAQELGCKVFRFSISWARVEPESGIFDFNALDHYHEVVSKIVEARMVPLVTLHHFTWPNHIQHSGGMIAPDFPQRFSRYVTQVVERIGDKVLYWVTFNEPNLLVYGYVKPWWRRDFQVPPGYLKEKKETTFAEQLQNAAQLIRHLFIAHRLARGLIKTRNPAARVGANPFIFGLPSWMQNLLDWLAVRLNNFEQFQKFTSGIGQRTVATRTPTDLVIAQLSRTPKRLKNISFSKPYGSASQRLLVKRGGDVSTIKDLKGLPVGFVRGSTAQETLSEMAPEAIPRRYETHRKAMAALEAGSVHGLVGDDAVFETLGIPATLEYKDLLKEQTYAVGVAEGNPDMLAIVNSLICERPLSGPIGTVPGSPIQRIRHRGVLNVGIRADEFEGTDTEITKKEREIASGVAKIILNDSKKIRFVKLSIANRVKALCPWYQFLGDLLKGIAMVSTALNGSWWHLGMRGKLPEFLCPKDCVGQQDFVGLDYYWGVSNFEWNRIHQLFEASVSNFADAPVDPPGLLRVLKRLHGWFPSAEILIIENGCIEFADGFSRATYLAAHIGQVKEARLAGVPVAAYICWSITSNREWGLRFSPASDFGLYHVELDGDARLVRIPTQSSKIYKDIIEGIAG
jgi:beta-glucosidase/6-phospho-beta-glucosidase/beta-galactosidase